MIEGKCPKCGARFFGWSLLMPRHQMCDKCGVGLEIKQDDGQAFKGYSSFEAGKYIIKSRKPGTVERRKDAK